MKTLLCTFHINQPIKGSEEVKEIPKSQRYIGRPGLAEPLKGTKGRKEISRKAKEAVEKYGYSQKEVADRGIQKILDCPVKPDNDKLITTSDAKYRYNTKNLIKRLIDTTDMLGNNSTKNKTILLVDDDAVVRNMIKEFLVMEYHVLEASGYQEVIHQLSSHIDLAIIDYVLSDCDGFEVLKALRKVNSTLPAIIMTGYSNENVVIKAIRSTVADYIKKPIQLAYLKMRISEILGGKEFNGQFKDVESRDEFILDGIATYIKENYKKDLTLNQISRMACMNSFKFCRAFKKRFGQSFIPYINNIRARNAAELLKNPDLNITEIAHFVGYGSFSQFERVFKQINGLSPREYRNKLKKEI